MRLPRILRLGCAAWLRRSGPRATLNRPLLLSGRRLLRLGRRRLLGLGGRRFLLLLTLRRARRLIETLLLAGSGLRRLLRLSGGGCLLLALHWPLRLRGTLRLGWLLDGRGLLRLRLLILWGRPRRRGGTLLRGGTLRLAAARLLLLLFLAFVC